MSQIKKLSPPENLSALPLMKEISYENLQGVGLFVDSLRGKLTPPPPFSSRGRQNAVKPGLVDGAIKNDSAFQPNELANLIVKAVIDRDEAQLTNLRSHRGEIMQLLETDGLGVDLLEVSLNEEEQNRFLCWLFCTQESKKAPDKTKEIHHWLNDERKAQAALNRSVWKSFSERKNFQELVQDKDIQKMAHFAAWFQLLNQWFDDHRLKTLISWEDDDEKLLEIITAFESGLLRTASHLSTPELGFLVCFVDHSEQKSCLRLANTEGDRIFSLRVLSNCIEKMACIPKEEAEYVAQGLFLVLPVFEELLPDWRVESYQKGYRLLPDWENPFESLTQFKDEDM